MTASEPYDKWIEEALLFVVWKALKETEENGIPLDHQFMITFETNRPDVNMPEYLKEKYPEEMMIILRYTFENLKVIGTPFDGHFSVSLSFNGKMENISVPFSALVSFSDPAVNFGIAFTPKKPMVKEEAITTKTNDKVVSVDFKKKKK